MAEPIISIGPTAETATVPGKRTLKRAQRDRREGKSASAQAGEFVREEIEHIREGKHGARSARQAIAIGLSKARRAGVELPPQEKGAALEETRRKAKHDAEAGARPTRKAASKKTASRTPVKEAARKAARTRARHDASRMKHNGASAHP